MIEELGTPCLIRGTFLQVEGVSLCTIQAMGLSLADLLELDLDSTT